MNPTHAPLPPLPFESDAGAFLFSEVRYALPELLRDVQRDRSSMAFAMEKLDQAAINALFEQQQARHAAAPGA